MNDKILDRIRKIRELALRGVAGEKEGAQQLLEELVKKYHLEDYEFDEDEEKDFDFEFHGLQEKKILLQVYYKVTNQTQMYDLVRNSTGRRIRTQVRASCTEAQKVEIDFLFDFYKRLWYEEVQVLLAAFIQKHSLFGTPNPGTKSDNGYDDETIERIFKMMRGLRTETPLKQIESE